MPTAVLARKLAALTGRKIDDDEARRLGTAIHWRFGASWGPVATFASRELDLHPLRAGIFTGLLVWAVADEGANTMLGLAAPPGEWPLSTHARALANHLVYGATIGTAIALGRTWSPSKGLYGSPAGEREPRGDAGQHLRRARSGPERLGWLAALLTFAGLWLSAGIVGAGLALLSTASIWNYLLTRRRRAPA